MGSPPKWYVIAKNEWRLKTSAVRGIRPYLLPFILAFLAVYVAWIAPSLMASVVPSFLAFLLSQTALATMELVLLTCFCYFLVIPFTNALQDIRVQEQEVLLAAPVSPGDILVGKFLGVLPLYTIGFVLFIGTFTALLAPAGLDGAQLVLTVVVILLVLLSGLWLGVVGSAVLRARLERSPRGRDAGKALGFIMALPIVALTYAMMGGFLSDLAIHPEANPAVAAILTAFPSSWGADLVLSFAAHPGNLAAMDSGDILRLFGIVAFFVAALGIGVLAANRAYCLEAGTFTAARARADGAFYRGLRISGGATRGTLLLAVFKDYARRLENTSRLVYIVGLLILMRVFFATDAKSPNEAVEILFILTPLLAAFAVGDVTARGRDVLFLYRKSPAGESALVRSKLVQGWVVVVPMIVVFAAWFLWGVPGTNNPLVVLTFLGVMALVAATDVAFVLGFGLVFPTFSDRPQAIVVSGVVPMMVALFAFIPLLLGLGETFGTMAFLAILAALAVALMILGMRHLRRIE